MKRGCKRSATDGTPPTGRIEAALYSSGNILWPGAGQGEAVCWDRQTGADEAEARRHDVEFRVALGRELKGNSEPSPLVEVIRAVRGPEVGQGLEPRSFYPLLRIAGE